MPECRQRSELWCAVQPRAPYIVDAVRAPFIGSSPMKVEQRLVQLGSLAVSAGQ